MKPLPYDRGRQILTLLALHEPLSVRGLSQMLEPEMKPRRLRDALSRLYLKNLITKRNDRVFGGAATFYQISRDHKARKAISEVTGISISDLDRNPPRHAELLHWESCSVFAVKLQKLFPEAKILREHEFKTQQTIADYFASKEGTQSEVKPDLIIRMERNGELVSLTIAVEIERTLKSDERIRRKLKIYANETPLDGVIYICDLPEVARKIELIYRSKNLHNSLRVGNYGNLFLMFLDQESTHKEKTFRLINSECKTVSIETWINFLRGTSRNFRRNKELSSSASSG